MEKPENETGGKGDVRKMRGGVGKTEEVDVLWDGKGENVVEREKRFEIAYILCTVTLE